MIHQPFQGEHSSRIGLCFFQAAIDRTNGFPNTDLSRRCTRRSARKRRTQPVTDLVHDRAQQITFARNFRRLLRFHQLARDRQDDVVHARVHEVLEEKFLAALLFVHSRIVRQIVRHGLVPVSHIAGTKWSIHHFHRRLESLFRRPIFRRQRQRILNLRHVFLEQLQLLALALVAHHHRRAVRTFHAQQSVQVSFIGRKDDVEFRILQLQPGQVAREVIVAEQGIGPQSKKLRESRVITEIGGCPQRLRRRLQKSAKRDVVGNRLQLSLIPPHDRELVVDRRLLFRMLLDVLLHLIARQVRGIEASPRRRGFGPDETAYSGRSSRSAKR